jgi:hypothetical protein
MEDLSEITNGSVAHSTVGFVDPASKSSLGSGTLIQFRGQPGILTCAHVVAALRQCARFGVMYHTPRSQNRGQKLVIDYSHCDAIVFSGAKDEQQGPDLAFLILPPGPMDALAAVGTVTNGDKRLAELCEEEPEAQSVVDVVYGVIAELTKGIVGRAAHKDFSVAFDLVDFEPVEAADDPLPKSFGGLSGGGLWRLFINYDEHDRPVLHRMHLIGVAFFETAQRRIICHGPRSIYEMLRPRLAS